MSEASRTILVNGRIILKWILKKWNWDLYWTGLGYDRGNGGVAVLNALMYFVIKSGEIV